MQKRKLHPTTLRRPKVEISTTSNKLIVAAQSPLPTRTLVLDNGGDSVKYGWADGTAAKSMPNVTARLSQQWAVLVGDEVRSQVNNPNSCLAVTRSTERGITTNMGNQFQVWKRVLDVLGVVISMKPNASTPFGWNTIRSSTKSATENKNNEIISSSQCAVLIAVAPYTPQSVLDHIISIWLEDFSFAFAGFCASSVTAAVYRPISSLTSKIRDGLCTEVPIACVVDLGWSAVHVVPVYQDRVIGKKCIRRLPLGARQMINIWKYYSSYRQWNLMDSEWIIRDVFESTAYVSLQFIHDMQTARKMSAGRRPFDCEYVLPDYDSTFEGRVQIPEAVLREIEKQKQNIVQRDDDDSDEAYEEKDMEEDVDDIIEEDEASADVVSSDDESPEELRKQMLKQREDDRRRRELEAEQHQILNITVERFAIPEALFRPSDVGLPSEWANLPQAIVQAIEACPLVFRAGLYRSIQLTGGLSQLPNLKERLEQELRALVPSQYPIAVTTSAIPLYQAWEGARKLATLPHIHWSVSRAEWELASRQGAWNRLRMSAGGYIL